MLINLIKSEYSWNEKETLHRLYLSNEKKYHFDGVFIK